MFKYEELSLLTNNELYRLSKLPIKISRNDIRIKTNDVKNEILVSFLNVLQLLHSNNEHLLVDKLKMCNYRLDRTRFCVSSVTEYLLIRYLFKFSNLSFIEIINTIKSSVFKNAAQEDHLFYDSYPVLEPHDDFIVGIDLCSDAERFILSNYEDLVLCNTYINMSIDYYIGCHRKHSESNNHKNELEEDLSFNFIDLIDYLSFYENPQRLQRGLNYVLALCNYEIDRSTFNASSVVEYLAIQDPHSFQFQELIFFIYCENEEGKDWLKDLKSAIKKNKA